MIQNFLFSFVGLIIGLFLGILIKKSETDRLLKENNDYKNQITELNEKTVKMVKDLSEKQAELALLQDLRQMLQKDFKNIANEIISEEQKDLRAQNKEALEEKFKPIQERFDKLKDKFDEFNTKGEIQNASLKLQIENLMKESRDIQSTANKLANAIKDNAKTRGDFGEIILENLLKQSGLVNKKDNQERGNYITQCKFYDINTKETFIPDAVIYFPDNKQIIVDSKCPLNNFIEFCNSEDEQEKEHQLKLFYDSADKMVDDLSKKYNTLEGITSPEFKLMFIPLESCASYIYTNTPLLNKAVKNNIIIVCPSTLLATLKIVNKTWQNKAQSENFENMFKIVQGIYDKVKIFIEKSSVIQKKIQAANEAFEDLYKTAEGKGGILSQAKKLEDCGINSTKKLNDKLMQE